MARRSSTVVTIVSNRFPELAQRLPVETGEIVKKTLLQIESVAKQRAPVDTGALRASYTTEMESETSGVVYTAIEYAPFVEFGTSKAPAQPHLTPAAEGERSRFNSAMSRLEGQLG